MAFYSDSNFTTFQGRAISRGEIQRLRLPLATLALGLIAALAIAAGALNWIPEQQAAPSGELTNIEFLTGVPTPAE
ncbi:hypothetical protein [Celeribacter sp.]|uniref:hypothetical protein n=1 Tax=Celeribacter sp. TaxID=1890673 RepID=UPI003A934F87